ncbi:hypothetical protein HG536_0E02920 [Torulaspora globosa]|uniref:Uncharacterized protein n=1 Tax=Torulaspora globosa TaxID=48254 RepID=A0A7G3ZIP5_9SACH|nr:uncharacterized protein HG536_0E02920 [Torulaspora globosa]QLL33381.1 hypothetical protein HG536_0E02920 [Torulaspora globosa]
MAINIDRSVLVKQFTDHLLLFGSTGLVGSLTLNELRKINFHLNNSQDIQQKLDSCQRPEVVNFRFDKFIYCINRKIKQFCNAGDGQFTETHGFQILKYNKKEYSLSKIKKLPPGVSTVSDKSPIGDDLSISKTISIKGDYIEEILNFCIDKQRYQVDYVSDSAERISLTFNIYAIQIASPDSRKWTGLLPLIFSGCVNIKSKAANGIMETRLPPLDEIPTMICALGSSSSGHPNKTVDRNYADHELTFQLVRVFNNCERKRLVIITTFNNVLISRIFPYFRTKSKLEYDLQYKLSPRLGQLVLLRPGPLVGDHTDLKERRVTVKHSSNLLKQILYYKKCCFQCKLLLFKECRRTGFRTKASEIIAKSMYRKPGSWILGYCLPASKVAHTAALKAVEPPADGTKHLVEIITSEEMDNSVPS